MTRANVVIYCPGLTSQPTFYYCFHTEHWEGASIILYGWRFIQPTIVSWSTNRHDFLYDSCLYDPLLPKHCFHHLKYSNYAPIIFIRSILQCSPVLGQKSHLWKSVGPFFLVTEAVWPFCILAFFHKQVDPSSTMPSILTLRICNLGLKKRKTNHPYLTNQPPSEVEGVTIAVFRSKSR